jgi:5-methylcytosine-specific restriction protein A
MWLYNKQVDWSLLTEGVTIPVKYHILIENFLKSSLKHGDKSSVDVLLSGKLYSVTLTNVNFDQVKFKGHVDMIQLRWNKSSPLAQQLRLIFQDSYELLYAYRNDKTKNEITKPEINEFIIFAFNTETKVLELTCTTNHESIILKNEFSSTSEAAFEQEQNLVIVDKTASIRYSITMQKIRILDRSISLFLKDLYSYHCQICNAEFEKYGTRYIEAHHIVPFVQSINNNSDNILIICPNHHRIIHNADPIFYPERHIFIYPNGYQEPLLLNKHIEIL